MSASIFILFGISAQAQERKLVYLEVKNHDVFFRITIVDTGFNTGMIYVLAEKHPYGIGRFQPLKIKLTEAEIKSIESSMEALTKTTLGKPDTGLLRPSTELREGIFEIFPEDRSELLKAPDAIVLREVVKTKTGEITFKALASPVVDTLMNQIYEKVFEATQTFYKEGPNPRWNPGGAKLLIPGYDDEVAESAMAAWCDEGPMNEKIREEATAN